MEDEVREWVEGDTELETQTRRNPSIYEMWGGNLSQLLLTSHGGHRNLCALRRRGRGLITTEQESTKEYRIPRLKNHFILLLCVYECFACMCVCVPRVGSAHGGHKRASDPLELELQMIVSHHGHAGDGTQGPERAARALNR